MLRIAIILMFPFLLNACTLGKSVATETPPLSNTLRHWSPDSEPDAVVLALHSFGDFSAAFAQLGPRFSESGLYLESYDQAGFGERQLEGRWAGEEQLVQEASQRIQHLSSLYQQPVFVMGESLGGAVAILAALENPDSVAGIILSAPAVREGIRFRYGWNLAIASAAAVAPGYRVSVERDPEDPSLAPANAQRLATDDRVMRQVRLDSYWGLIQIADSASDRVPNLIPLQIPVLLLYGENDNSVPEAGILALRQHLQQQLTYHPVPGGPHLLLQGAQWQATSQLIIHWIEQQTASRTPHQKTSLKPATVSTIGPAGQLHAGSD